MKMPTENINKGMFAPCGMNCMVCYKHCYHKKPCAGCLNSEKIVPRRKGCLIVLHVPNIPVSPSKTLKKATTKGIRRALWRIVKLFVNTGWKGLWKCRNGNIRVQNAAVLFLSMTENAVSVRKA